MRSLKTLVTENEDAPLASELEGVFQAHLRRRAAKVKVDQIVTRLLREAKAFRRNTAALNKVLGSEEAIPMLNNLAGRRRGRAYWSSGEISMPLLDSAVHQLQSAKTINQKLLAIARLVTLIEDPEPDARRADAATLYPYLMQVEDWTPARRQEFSDFLQGATADVVARLAQQVLRQDRRNQPLQAARPKGW